MRTTKNIFNPHKNPFDTTEGWLKILTPSVDWWKSKGILRVAPPSILEDLKLSVDLGIGKKQYQFQLTNGVLLAFPDDDIGSTIEITDQIYKFHIDLFLETLAFENKFTLSKECYEDTDYKIGCFDIGNKKIIWICSFSIEGFQRYKTKSYFEDLERECNFILLSDCTYNKFPNIKNDKMDYVPLPFNPKNFKIDPHKFLKRTIGVTSDEMRNVIKQKVKKVLVFVNVKSQQIYYKDKLIVRKNNQTYKFFIALLKEPSQEHDVEYLVKEKVGLSENQDLSLRGRALKGHIRNSLKEVCSQEEVDKILPKGKDKKIYLNLSKESIFFF